jgi:pimeloyl-ACP methyl ester carboxylesterase/DNA-binding CsgD family transcriptional regulator
MAKTSGARPASPGTTPPRAKRSRGKTPVEAGGEGGWPLVGLPKETTMVPAAQGAIALPQNSLASDIIGRLYDVALDPLRLEDLLEDWDRLYAPLRRAQERAVPVASDPENPLRRVARLYQKTRRPRRPAVAVPDLTDHFRRVAALLAQTQVTRDLRPEEVELARFARTAAFAVAGNLRIASANRAAQIALQAQQGRGLDSLPFDEADRAMLACRLRQVLGEAPTEDGSERGSLLRLRRQGSNQVVLLHLTVIRPADAPAFAVVVTSELRWPDRLNQTLRDVFALTPAEIEILRALSEALSLKTIAEQRGRSIETVRAQIKAILSKTETTSQSELLRLTLTIMEVVPDPPEQDPSLEPWPRISRGTETLQERPFHTLMRPDGRRVEYLLLGDPGGRPVLYTHGPLGLCRWPGALERQAAEAGLCIVVPVRPGYGGSTPLAGAADRRREVAGDMAALMDRLGIASAAFLTLDLDVHYVVHLNAMFPGRVKALIAVGASLPLTHRAQYERMGRWHLFHRACARYTPALYPFLVQAGFAMLRRMGKQAWVRKIYIQSKSDSAVADRPDVFEAIDVGMDTILHDGFEAVDACAAELITSERISWRHEIEAMRNKVPIHFLHGDDDLQIVPATRQELIEDYPWIAFHLVPNAGQLLLFQAGEIALNWLRKYQ